MTCSCLHLLAKKPDEGKKKRKDEVRFNQLQTKARVEKLFLGQKLFGENGNKQVFANLPGRLLFRLLGPSSQFPVYFN